MVWIVEGTMTVGPDWNRSSFELTSNVVKIRHNLLPDAARLFSGLIALTVRDTEPSGLLDTQRLDPTADKQIIIYPQITGLDGYGIAVKSTRRPGITDSILWQVTISTYVELEP